MLAPFFVAGLLALRSSAFLVVPQTHDINPIDAEDARRMSVDLECPGCPFPADDGEELLKNGVDSTLVRHVFVISTGLHWLAEHVTDQSLFLVAQLHHRRW